jgi:predicted nucleic acid-binding protein
VKVYFDTAVIVAASIARHVHHAQAIQALKQVHSGDLKGILSAHGLAESFSVLTRTSFSPPILPHDAWLFLSDNVLRVFDLVTLTATEYREVIERCSQNAWSGGRVYDALHIHAAKKAGCGRIYTFNLKHFHQVGPEIRDIIVSP